eukprot:GFYU01016066.1.p1 GENE.GFYU01016066.1~~GFYU01016066.1.p1  ORF type:complete len:298 (+),score=67.49 GFYU01016066.1:167-1060(+)
MSVTTANHIAVQKANEALSAAQEQPERSLLVNSHHDPARRYVSMTARGTAAMRAVESAKPESVRLINDPYAEILAGEEGMALRNESWWREGLVDLLATRTAWIDTQLEKHINDGIDQLVIVGAGLDSRPYRLDALKAIRCYEVDFQEVLDIKQETMTNHGVFPVGPHFEVGCDLSVGSAWVDALKDSGFETEQKSLWLLEGFVGYLTEEELRGFYTLVNSVCAPGSKMVSTFVGTKRVKENKFHKYLTDDPAKILSDFEWKADDVISLLELCGRYNRVDHEEKNDQYWFVDATYKEQ